MKMSFNFKLRIILLATFLVGFLTFLGIKIHYKVYILPYEKFQASEAIANPKFAALNDALYSQIPLPNGVDEESRSQQTALNSSHGVHMYLDYLMVNTTPSEVQSYYDDFFLKQGWEKYELSSKGLGLVYYHGTSCYQINMSLNHLGEISNQYLVFIYHDFFEQEFSPIIPPRFVLSYHEVGKTSFTRCPPFLDPPTQP
jgi:hypothetical protein